MEIESRQKNRIEKLISLLSADIEDIELREKYIYLLTKELKKIQCFSHFKF